jgi:Tol biopolymer transport system component
MGWILMRLVWAEPYNVHIFIAAADGSGRKDITKGDGTDWNNPSWSPDGQRMAASAGTYSQVENMDLTGNDRIQVTNIGTNRNPLMAE